MVVFQISCRLVILDVKQEIVEPRFHRANPHLTTHLFCKCQSPDKHHHSKHHRRRKPHDYQGMEVDFVIKEGARVKELIQVTYASGKDEIERREIKYGEIRFVPLWKWLFMEKSCDLKQQILNKIMLFYPA